MIERKYVWEAPGSYLEARAGVNNRHIRRRSISGHESFQRVAIHIFLVQECPLPLWRAPVTPPVLHEQQNVLQNIPYPVQDRYPFDDASSPANAGSS